MKNTMAISELSRQMAKVSERIETLGIGIEQFEQGNTDLVSTYETFMLDELEHAQMLTLKLTELITAESTENSEANADEGDGSAFAAGDLTKEKAGEIDGTGVKGDQK